MAASKQSLLGATLLIAGTCVGGGILALPVETGMAGFVPSILTMTLAWIFMTTTGLYYAEANLWLSKGSHVMTMASQLLGPLGKYASLVLFLFIDYASLVAYNAAGGTLLGHFFEKILSLHISRSTELFLFAVLFGSLLYLGTKVIGRINSILMAGLIAAYAALIGLGITEVKASMLSTLGFKYAPTALPLVLTTFSFQMIVPSLTPYLNRDSKAIKKAIIFGTSIPFAVYLIWQAVVLGIVPVEALSSAFTQGSAATEPLRAALNNRALMACADAFAFFAIVTSYLGIGLSLYDFLSDSIHLPRKGIGKIFLSALVLIPSLFFAIVYPRAFLVALEVTGGYGDTLLNGLIPISMIWVGRYVKNLQGPMRVWGGKRLLVVMALFALLVIGTQTANFF